MLGALNFLIVIEGEPVDILILIHYLPNREFWVGPFVELIEAGSEERIAKTLLKLMSWADFA